jgi:hypothetical protein
MEKGRFVKKNRFLKIHSRDIVGCRYHIDTNILLNIRMLVLNILSRHTYNFAYGCSADCHDYIEKFRKHRH